MYDPFLHLIAGVLNSLLGGGPRLKGDLVRSGNRAVPEWVARTLAAIFLLLGLVGILILAIFLVLKTLR